jgi:hypothetical protein
MLSSKKSTRSRKESYLKTRCSEPTSLQLLQQSNQKNNRHELVIITDSLSTIVAAESRTLRKNPKTQTIRKMLDQEGPRTTLLWVPSHKRMPSNEKADQAAKEALDEDIPTTERYPPDDLKKWLTIEELKKRDQRWKNGNNMMIERKPDVDRKEDTKRNAKERASGNIQT